MCINECAGGRGGGGGREGVGSHTCVRSYADDRESMINWLYSSLTFQLKKKLRLITG